MTKVHLVARIYPSGEEVFDLEFDTNEQAQEAFKNLHFFIETESDGEDCEEEK